MINMQSEKISGFTLIELLIVVAIVGIIVAFGYPIYTNKVIETRRTDAKSALAKLANLQEKIFTECNRYATQLTNIVAGSSCTSGPAGLDGIPTPEIAWDLAANMPTVTTGLSADGHYVISILPTPPGPNAPPPCGANCFLLETNPTLAGASGLQVRNGVSDGNFRLDHAGRKSWQKGGVAAPDATLGMYANKWTDK